MNKKFGFTLAEVLIALTVVGVVSALTVPTLMNKYTKKTQAELIHKTYVDFGNAIELYMNDEDKKNVAPLLTTLDGDEYSVNYFLTTYFRVNKNCKSAPSGSCLSSDFKTFAGASKTNGPYSAPSNYSCIQNTAGVTICMNKASVTNKLQETAAKVWVDTNGIKEPNMKGRDVFVFSLRKDGSIDDSMIGLGNANQRELNFINGCAKESNVVVGCIGKLINDNWEMNY